MAGPLTWLRNGWAFARNGFKKVEGMDGEKLSKAEKILNKEEKIFAKLDETREALKQLDEAEGINDLQATIRGLQRQARDLDGPLEEASRNLKRVDTQLQNKKLELYKLEDEIFAANNKVNAARQKEADQLQEITKLDQKIRNNTEKISNLETKKIDLEGEDLIKANAKLEDLEATQKTLENNRKIEIGVLEELEEESRQAVDTLYDLEQKKPSLEDEVRSLQNRTDNAQNQYDDLKEQRDVLEDQINAQKTTLQEMKDGSTRKALEGRIEELQKKKPGFYEKHVGKGTVVGLGVLGTGIWAGNTVVNMFTEEELDDRVSQLTVKVDGVTHTIDRNRDIIIPLYNKAGFFTDEKGNKLPDQDNQNIYFQVQIRDANGQPVGEPQVIPGNVTGREYMEGSVTQTEKAGLATARNVGSIVGASPKSIQDAARDYNELMANKFLMQHFGQEMVSTFAFLAVVARLILGDKFDFMNLNKKDSPAKQLEEALKEANTFVEQGIQDGTFKPGDRVYMKEDGTVHFPQGADETGKTIEIPDGIRNRIVNNSLSTLTEEKRTLEESLENIESRLSASPEGMKKEQKEALKEQKERLEEQLGTNKSKGSNLFEQWKKMDASRGAFTNPFAATDVVLEDVARIAADSGFDRVRTGTDDVNAALNAREGREAAVNV